MTSLKNSSLEDNLYIALESIYFLHRMGDHAAADLLSEESAEQIENSAKYKKLIKLVDLIGQYEQNKFSGAHHEKLLQIKKPIEDTGIAFYRGWLHLLSGHFLKSETELKMAASFFLKGPHFNELYETYYWMNNFRLLPRDEKYSTFLRTYPAQSIYSKIMGNNFYDEEDVLPLTQVQKAQAQTWLVDEEDDRFDCWLISGEAITPATYRQVDLSDENFLDIYSGFLNDRGEFIFLLISELNCLSFLIATRLTGASVAQVADFLEQTEEDAEKTIQSLIQMGLKIEKHSGFYFLNWEAKPKIIIPRTLKVVGLQEYVKKKSPIFTKAQLMDVLQLSTHGAESLVKRWLLKGFIETQKSDNDDLWKFI